MSIGVVDLFNQLAENDFGFFQKVTSVEDLMTTEVKTLTLDDTFEVAESLLKRSRFHHVPIIEPDSGEVVGVISDRDTLRQRGRLVGTLAESNEDHRALTDCVAQFMTRNPLHLSPGDSPVEALNLMLDHHVDCVLVYEDPKELLGIVTHRDFIKALLLFHRVCTRTTDLRRLRLVDLDLSRGIPLDVIFSRGAQTVRDVMTTDVIHLKASDTVEHAIDVMQVSQIRHLPVVDEEEKVLGMVSDREILHWLPVPKNRPMGGTDGFRAVLFATDDKKAMREPVSTIMTKEPTAVRPEALLLDVMSAFQEQTVNGFPVLDALDNKLQGIVTTSDVLRVFRVVMMVGSLAGSGQVCESE